MSSALLSSRLVRSGRRGLLQQRQQQQQQVRHKHRVRVIVTRDLPEGQMRGAYAGEVHDVAAGYARNYLVPEKYAVYATPRNFERCGLVDTAQEDAAAADPASGGIVAEGVDVVGGDDAKDCDAKVKQLGDYVAKITLRGGYVVPLKFSVVRR